MKIRNIILSIIATILLFAPSLHASEKNDTLIMPSSYQFRAKDLILPGALIAVGTTSLFFPPMKDLDKSVQKGMMNLRGNHHRIELDEYLRYVPTAITATFIITDFFSDSPSSGINGLINPILSTVTSTATMYVLTQGLKYTVKRKRPDGSDYHSFPSGHAASVFLSAESVRMSYGKWWGLAAYSAATATAVLRLYNNRHWLGDVIAGAGIGILSARIGDWLVPFERKILGLDKKKDKQPTSMVVLPTYDAYSNSYGIAFAMQF